MHSGRGAAVGQGHSVGLLVMMHPKSEANFPVIFGPYS